MKLKIKLRNILSVKIHKIVLLLLALCIYNTAYGQNQQISVYGNNQSLRLLCNPVLYTDVISPSVTTPSIFRCE